MGITEKRTMNNIYKKTYSVTHVCNECGQVAHKGLIFEVRDNSELILCKYCLIDAVASLGNTDAK